VGFSCHNDVHAKLLDLPPGHKKIPSQAGEGIGVDALCSAPLLPNALQLADMKQLLLKDAEVADGNASPIIIDAPAVLLDAIDALGVSTYIVDVKNADGVVGEKVYLVDIVFRTSEIVAVDAFDEALTALAFLFEVHLAGVLVFRIDNHGVILLGVGATHEGNTEFVPIVARSDSETDVVVRIETIEEHVCIVARE
jgi:hypothetical protein